MIKTRLVKLLSHAKKYIVLQVAWKWMSLLCQVVMIYAAVMLLEGALFGKLTGNRMASYGALVLAATLLRSSRSAGFLCLPRSERRCEADPAGEDLRETIKAWRFLPGKCRYL